MLAGRGLPLLGSRAHGSVRGCRRHVGESARDRPSASLTPVPGDRRPGFLPSRTCRPCRGGGHVGVWGSMPFIGFGKLSIRARQGVSLLRSLVFAPNLHDVARVASALRKHFLCALPFVSYAFAVAECPCLPRPRRAARACWQPELLAAALSCTPQPPGPGGLRIYRGQRETKLGLPSLFCLSSVPRRSRPSALGAMNSDFRFSGTVYLPEEPISFSPSSSYLTTFISQTHKENSCNLSYSLCITSTMIAIFRS